MSARRTGFLASVATLGEMDAALAGGADIIDLKNPAAGALGAWTVPDLAAAVARWEALGPRRPLLSATVGDQPLVPEILAAAARTVAETGVPLVKVGLLAGPDDGPGAVEDCLAVLAPLAQETALVAVLFADRTPDFDLLPRLKAAGFRGAMLDTAGKAGGGLRDHLPRSELALFVAMARSLGLLTGLAGSLKLADIPPLRELAPDYLGFRGALCAGDRAGRLDPARLAAVRTALLPETAPA